jgi:FkbM family methyltransferase
MLSAQVYRPVASVFRWPCSVGFPGRGAVLRGLILNPAYEPYWKDAGLKWVRSNVHGYEMPCDLTISSGRFAYFLKRWNDAGTQSVLLTLLQSGDTFVDIGANVGMATLTAARAVGPDGRILAFEPNPEVSSILAQSLRRNGLDQVELHPSAIGERPGRFSLFVPDSNHGEASLGTQFAGRPGKLVEVDIVDGSRLAALDRCDFIKIDVEGYEVHVIEAISETIRRHRPFVSTEVVDRHLKRCGNGAAELAESLSRLGYTGFRYFHVAAGHTQLRAKLEAFQASGPISDSDVLWVPSERAESIRSIEFAAIRR